MLACEKRELTSLIEKWAQEYGRRREALLPILQRIQRRFRHVPEFAMQQVAKELGIFPSEVYGVVSFYSFLDVEPKGKFVIRLCRTISCDMAGKDKIARQLENELGIRFGETTEDGRFTLEWVNCLGLCDQGPAMLVNDKAYTKVTPVMVKEIIEECKRSFGPYTTHEEREEEH